MSPHWVMVIDLGKCVGCHACTVACKNQNNLADGMYWNRVLTVGPEGEFPNLSMFRLPAACMHCQQAPCVEGCPTGASYRREDGIVLVEESKCMGCQYCAIVCPYDARHFDKEKGIVTKCKFCVDRLDAGQLPACVETCQLKARVVGDANDPDSEVAQLIRSERVQRLHEELGTEPSIYYILP